MSLPASVVAWAGKSREDFPAMSGCLPLRALPAFFPLAGPLDFRGLEPALTFVKLAVGQVPSLDTKRYD